MINKSTRLDKMQLSHKNHLIYHFTLVSVDTTSPPDLIETLKSKFIPSIHPHILQDKEVSPYLSQGLTVTYLYRNSDGIEISSVTATPEEYRSHHDKLKLNKQTSSTKNL